jgi:hypothetical protein
VKGDKGLIFPFPLSLFYPLSQKNNPRRSRGFLCYGKEKITKGERLKFEIKKGNSYLQVRFTK